VVCGEGQSEDVSAVSPLHYQNGLQSGGALHYKNAIGAYYGNTIIRTESDEETVSWLVTVILTKVH